MAFQSSQPMPKEGENLLSILDTWQIREVAKQQWSLFAPLERVADIEAVFISGDAFGSTKPFGGMPSVAAMDVIVKEPKRRLGEPPTNIYHYAFVKDADGKVTQWGPSNDDTILGHWPLNKAVSQVVRDYRKLSDGLL